MQRTVVGIVDNYSTAQHIVQALELEGIVGNQVEVVSGADEEVLGQEGGSSAHKSHESFGKRTSHFVRSLTGSQDQKAHDDYVEDPEFYASQVRQGRAMVIVRLRDEPEANRVADLLRQYGANDLRGKHGPQILEENDQPESIPPSNAATSQSTMGEPGVTTGGTRANLEGHGQQIRKPA
jgi:hypothetical protein